MNSQWIHRLAVFFFGLALFAAPAAEARVVDGSVIMDQHMRENLCALTFDMALPPTLRNCWTC